MNDTKFEKHVSREFKKLSDFELGHTIVVCTDNYVCNITGEEFYVCGSGKTNDEAAMNCEAPTREESLNHILHDDNPYEIDFDRLREAMDTDRFTMPSGLTKEQMRQHILDCANGLIEPDVVK